MLTRDVGLTSVNLHIKILPVLCVFEGTFTRLNPLNITRKDPGNKTVPKRPLPLSASFHILASEKKMYGPGSFLPHFELKRVSFSHFQFSCFLVFFFNLFIYNDS